MTRYQRLEAFHTVRNFIVAAGRNISRNFTLFHGGIDWTTTIQSEQLSREVGGLDVVPYNALLQNLRVAIERLSNEL